MPTDPPRQPTPLPIVDRPIRVAVVGLGQVSELVVATYVGRTDMVVIGLCDRDPDRIARWVTVFPEARTTVGTSSRWPAGSSVR